MKFWSLFVFRLSSSPRDEVTWLWCDEMKFFRRTCASMWKSSSCLLISTLHRTTEFDWDWRRRWDEKMRWQQWECVKLHQHHLMHSQNISLMKNSPRWQLFNRKWFCASFQLKFSPNVFPSSSMRIIFRESSLYALLSQWPDSSSSSCSIAKEWAKFSVFFLLKVSQEN